MDDAARAQAQAQVQVETDAIAGFELRGAELAPLLREVGVVLQWMFRIGVVLLVLGLLLAVFRHEPLGERVDPLSQVIPAAMAGHASGVIDLAIIWLAAAPVVATIVVLVGFLRMGDRRYAVITGLVLTVLAVSILRALR